MSTATPNPAGWPQDLQPYNPGKHRPKVMTNATLYPYDHTPSRVKSWVAIRDGQYKGIVSRCKLPDPAFPGEEHNGYDAMTADGKNRMTSLDRNDVINFLVYTH